jgi:transaldolase
MKIFLDSADLTAISDFNSAGLIDGVTTNPTLLVNDTKKVGPKETICNILEIISGELSVEVTEKDVQKLEKQARDLAAISDKIVVKIPCEKRVLPVISRLSKDGIPVNVTLVFSELQAIFAAKAGAKYISVFLGRLEDLGVSLETLLPNLVKIFDRFSFKSRLLAASIRTIRHFSIAASAGFHVATVPPKILSQLFNNLLTKDGIRRFEKDWDSVKHEKFP